MQEPEFNYYYPREWEDEFRQKAFVQCWLDDCPNIFHESRCDLYDPDDSLYNFPPYALMYLLKRDEDLESLTYFRIAAENPDSVAIRRQNIMRRWMGDEAFERLQRAVREAGLTGGGFEGEPDLFCWNPRTREWFFAEAKGKDKLTKSQCDWFAVCRRTLPGVIIKVCRLRPETSNEQA